MNAHTRFALPINTPGNLKYLHDTAQRAQDERTEKKDAQASTTKERRDSMAAKFALKMKGVFSSKKTEVSATTEQEVDERKRSTMRQLVGSHAFVQMGRR